MADHTESAVLITAPPQLVLDVIADLEAYPTWAKGLSSVRVLTEDDGWADEAEFVVDAGAVRDAYVLRYTWDVDEKSCGIVSWQLVRGQSLSAMDGSYTVEAAPSGTHVIYRLAVELKVPMPALLRRRAEKSIVGTALDDLKRHVEAIKAPR